MRRVCFAFFSFPVVGVFFWRGVCFLSVDKPSEIEIIQAADTVSEVLR